MQEVPFRGIYCNSRPLLFPIISRIASVSHDDDDGDDGDDDDDDDV